MKDELVNWLEDFRSRFENYSESTEIIKECENILVKSEKILEPIRIPLLIKNARNERKGILEYGLDYHLKNFTTAVSII